MLPTIHGTARLVADPELRFTASGKAVVDVRLAFNSRKRNAQTNEWEDGETFFVRGSAWERLAENIAETLARGMEVTVLGELRTQTWEKDGQKFERPDLMIRSIGPSLAFATAVVTKAATGQNGAQGSQQRPPQGQQGQTQRSRPQQPPEDDPWATSSPAANTGRTNAGSYSDEPPF